MRLFFLPATIALLSASLLSGCVSKDESLELGAAADGSEGTGSTINLDVTTRSAAIQGLWAIEDFHYTLIGASGPILQYRRHSTDNCLIDLAQLEVAHMGNGLFRVRETQYPENRTHDCLAAAPGGQCIKRYYIEPVSGRLAVDVYDEGNEWSGTSYSERVEGLTPMDLGLCNSTAANTANAVIAATSVNDSSIDPDAAAIDTPSDTSDAQDSPNGVPLEITGLWDASNSFSSFYWHISEDGSRTNYSVNEESADNCYQASDRVELTAQGRDLFTMTFFDGTVEENVSYTVSNNTLRVEQTSSSGAVLGSSDERVQNLQFSDLVICDA